MYPFAKPLSVSDKNKLASYLPIRAKDNDFGWDVITGAILAQVMRRKTHQYGLEAFKQDCQTRLATKLDNPNFWPVLERMYFGSEAIYKVSPLFLMFKTNTLDSVPNDVGAANDRMAALFSSMMGDFQLTAELKGNPNFIEKEMLDVLNERLSASKPKPRGESPYLPWLAEAFQEDMAFLAQHPKYLLQELTNTLKLYAFTYSVQLALNIKGFRSGAPKSKPVYFILDTEKASSERKLRRYGYKTFAESSNCLFPYLSASEALQRKGHKLPLWQVFDDAQRYEDRQTILNELNNYIDRFAADRQLSRPTQHATSVDEAFAHVLDLAMQQFNDTRTYRSDINKKYVKAVEKTICGEFIQVRGRAGTVFVLNQNQLLLLTNLAIGQRDNLRLFELTRQFERRGFYLDNQSVQMLVNFYERLGNVERMSDSGDAVYVRKTI
jgi:DNA phosphorothioation-dependent restriction protein DptG